MALFLTCAAVDRSLRNLPANKREKARNYFVFLLSRATSVYSREKKNAVAAIFI